MGGGGGCRIKEERERVKYKKADEGKEADRKVKGVSRLERNEKFNRLRNNREGKNKKHLNDNKTGRKNKGG